MAAIKRKNLIFLKILLLSLFILAPLETTYSLDKTAAPAPKKTTPAQAASSDGNDCPGAQTYYVAKSGNDEANDGSLKDPWLTIQKAADQVKAGDTVFIKSGVYHEMITMKASGSEGCYVTFKGYPGHHPVINGGKSPQGYWGVISIYGHDYIKLEDMEITGNTIGWGVLVEHEQKNNSNAASHIVLSGLDIHHTGGEDIQIRGNAHNILIKNCVVHDGIPFEGHVRSGIDIYKWDEGRPHHVIVEGCKSYNYDTDNEFKGVGGGIASEQADYLIIRYNTVHNSKCGIDLGSGDYNIVSNNIIYDCRGAIAVSSNEDSEIFGNTIYNIYEEAFYNYYWKDHGEGHARNKFYQNVVYNAGFGFYESNEKRPGKGKGPTSDHVYYNNLFCKIGIHGAYRSSFYFKGTTNLKFYHNTIYMNKDHQAFELLDGAINADIRNNIISTRGSPAPIKVNSSAETGLIIDYNCYYNRSGREAGQGSHSINANPQFIDPEKDNLNLSANSPCLGKATDLGRTYSLPDIGFNP